MTEPVEPDDIAPIPTGGLVPLYVDADGVAHWSSSLSGATVPDHKHDDTVGGGGPAVLDFLGRNTSGASIPAFSAVRISGAASGIAQIALARANLSDNMPCAGITVAAIANNATGTVRTFGAILNIDTSAFAAADNLYVDGAVAGGIVASTSPTNYITQHIGAVLTSHATTGSVFVYLDPMMDGSTSYTNRDQFSVFTTGTTPEAQMIGSGGATRVLATPTGARVLTLPDATDTLVGKATTDTLTNKTLTTPTIASFTNAQHNHTNAAGGGTLGAAAFSAMTSAELRGIISDETGTGLAVFNDAPTFATNLTTPLAHLNAAGSPSFDLIVRNRAADVLTADRTLAFSVGDADRTLEVGASATVSGTNTGDQTITLTGQVTGSGTGSFAATITPGTAGYTLKSSSASSPATAWEASGIMFRREWQLLADPGAASATSVGLLTAPTLSGTVSSQDNATRPFVRHVTGAVSGNSGGVLSGFNVTRSGWLSKTAFVYQPGSTITSGRWWCGFTTADLTAVATPTTEHVAAFSYDTGRDGTVFWRTVTCDGTTATVTASSVAFAASTTYNLRIEMNGVTNVLFWIDDVLVATHTTNLPAVTQLLGFQMSVTTLTAATRRFEWSRIGGVAI